MQVIGCGDGTFRGGGAGGFAGGHLFCGAACQVPFMLLQIADVTKRLGLLGGQAVLWGGGGPGSGGGPAGWALPCGRACRSGALGCVRGGAG